jgi:type II secretory pathway pseudopilin PulG
MRKQTKQYTGFSFVEMLLTMMILGVIMLLVATTLNTVIKASNTANSKNLARSEINYIMDLYNRLLTNAELSDIYLFESRAVREFNLAGGIPVISNTTNLGNTYLDETLTDGKIGNEIHVKLYGYSLWTCLGYFKSHDGEYGYIVKATAANLSDHSTCFNESSVISLLHSFSVDASDLDINYINIGDGKNSMFVVNAELTPLYWPVSDSFPVTRAVSRQIVVSTQALTWY